MHPNLSIRVAAVVLTNDAGQVALVRKYQTTALIFPGGKPEPGETARAAAARELHEELRVNLRSDQLEHLGDFTTLAANEAETQLISQVYRAVLPAGQQAQPQSEIAQLIWCRPDRIELPSDTRLAPLSSLVLSGLAPGGLAFRSRHKGCRAGLPHD